MLSKAAVDSAAGTRATISGSADLDIDAAAGTDFFTWLDGNRTVNEPTNPSTLRIIRLWVTQDSTGSRTLTWNAIFRFSTDIPAPTLTTTGGYTDLIEFIYNEYYNTWDCIRVVKGYLEPAV